MHENQGDVLLPLSTLKRTVCSAVPTVADVVRLKGTAVKLSGEGGQATNSLPIMQHRKTKMIPTDTQFLVPKRNNIQFARISLNTVGFNAIMNTYIVKFREVCL